MFELIKRRVTTEKASSLLREKGQYTYDVDLRLTKTQIKKLFKHLYDVEITWIHTHVRPLKRRSGRLQRSYKSHYKRVIFKIKQVHMLPWEESALEKAQSAKQNDAMRRES